MRFTKKEKEALFKLLDVMTDGCPINGLHQITDGSYKDVFWSMYKKVRCDLKGF